MAKNSQKTQAVLKSQCNTLYALTCSFSEKWLGMHKTVTWDSHIRFGSTASLTTEGSNTFLNYLEGIKLKVFLVLPFPPIISGSSKYLFFLFAHLSLSSPCYGLYYNISHFLLIRSRSRVRQCNTDLGLPGRDAAVCTLPLRPPACACWGRSS